MVWRSIEPLVLVAAMMVRRSDRRNGGRRRQRTRTGPGVRIRGYLKLIVGIRVAGHVAMMVVVMMVEWTIVAGLCAVGALMAGRSERMLMVRVVDGLMQLLVQMVLAVVLRLVDLMVVRRLVVQLMQVNGGHAVMAVRTVIAYAGR